MTENEAAGAAPEQVRIIKVLEENARA